LSGSANQSFIDPQVARNITDMALEHPFRVFQSQCVCLECESQNVSRKGTGNFPISRVDFDK